jgi:3-hydroxyacyl-CoA dehydrogenase
MKITLKNSVISKASNFVEQIKVKGKDTLALGKFKKLLNRRLQEAAEDEQTLLKSHTYKKDGEDKLDDDYKKEHESWLDQDAEIEGGTYVNHIDDVDHIIDSWVERHEIAGPDLDGYLALHEAFEDAKAPADEAKKED